MIRYVIVDGVKYLRAEDVGKYLNTLASTEEIDTRKRLEQAALSLTTK